MILGACWNHLTMNIACACSRESHLNRGTPVMEAAVDIVCTLSMHNTTGCHCTRCWVTCCSCSSHHVLTKCHRAMYAKQQQWATGTVELGLSHSSLICWHLSGVTLDLVAHKCKAGSERMSCMPLVARLAAHTLSVQQCSS